MFDPTGHLSVVPGGHRKAERPEASDITNVRTAKSAVETTSASILPVIHRRRELEAEGDLRPVAHDAAVEEFENGGLSPFQLIVLENRDTSDHIAALVKGPGDYGLP